MGTTSIAEYQKIIDKEIKRIACSDSWCSIKNMLGPLNGSRILKLINNASEDNITDVMKQMGISNKLINIYLIYALSKMCSHYIEGSQLTCLGSHKAHTTLVAILNHKAIEAQSTLRLRYNLPLYIQNSIHDLIQLLEDGVLYSPCNRYGSFANMCRAIVLKTRGLPEWNVEFRFLRFLGLQTLRFLDMETPLQTSLVSTPYLYQKTKTPSVDVPIIRPARRMQTQNHPVINPQNNTPLWRKSTLTMEQSKSRPPNLIPSVIKRKEGEGLSPPPPKTPCFFQPIISGRRDSSSSEHESTLISDFKKLPNFTQIPF